MKKCGQCGGKLRRVHRTFLERFRYLAIYECRHCEREVLIPRRYTYHFGDACRCPKCGTFRVVKLKAPDKIDPMHGGFLGLMERLSGGNLYHCCFCRVQFFDRRPLSPNSSRTSLETAGRTPSDEDEAAEMAGAAEAEDEIVVAAEVEEGPVIEVHPEVIQDQITIRQDKASSGG